MILCDLVSRAWDKKILGIEWKNRRCWGHARNLYLGVKEFEYERQLEDKQNGSREDKQNGSCEDKQNGQNRAEDGPFPALIFPELPAFIFREIGEYADMHECKCETFWTSASKGKPIWSYHVVLFVFCFIVQWWERCKQGSFVMGRASQKNECYLGKGEGGAITTRYFFEGEHEWDLTVVGITEPSKSPKYPLRNGIGIVCCKRAFCKHTNTQNP